jgi:hypothetical protein
MLTKPSRGPRFARSDIRFWENAVFQCVRYRKGKKDRSKHFSVRFSTLRMSGCQNKAISSSKAMTRRIECCDEDQNKDEA